MATQDEKDTKVNALGEQAGALAEQLGRIAGTIEGTAEQWLNRQALTEQLTRVRDSAAQMLESLAGGADQGRKSATDTFRTAAGKVSRAAGKVGQTASRAIAALPGRTSAKKKKKTAKSSKSAASAANRAHAPGKRHRKPAPTVKGAKKSDERIPKMRTARAARQRRKSYA